MATSEEMFTEGVQQIFELFNSIMESEYVLEKEQTPLNKTEIDLQMGFKIVATRKRRK